jgi:hypothetical protein
MMAYGENEAARRMGQLLGRPRNLALTGPLMSIIVNLLLIAVALAGLVAAANGLRFGQTLVFGAMIWSITHTIHVRAKIGGNSPPDERERAVAAEAMAFGGFMAASLVSIWFLFLGVFADDGMWFPQESREWQALGFFVTGLTTQATNIAAAWKTPAYSGVLMDEH